MPFNSISWLRNNASGFPELDEGEIQAITSFSLMWSFFEAKVLNNHASISSLKKVSRNFRKYHLIETKTISQSFLYFRNRYINDGVRNHFFRNLRIKQDCDKDFIFSVLNCESPSSEDILSACLIIVYRFRNNFFHGEKWAYEFQEQRQNFEISNQLLAEVVLLHRSIQD